MPDDFFQTLCTQLEKEIAELKKDIADKNSRVKVLEEQFEALQNYHAQYKEVQDNYQKEQDRLTKLYHEYERAETENQKLREELKGWQEWVEQNKDLYDRLFAASPPQGATLPKEQKFSQLPHFFLFLIISIVYDTFFFVFDKMC